MNRKIEGIIFDWVGTLYKRGEGIFPWSAHVLQTLKPSYKLGLVSIAKEGVAQRKQELGSSGILHYFDAVIVDVSKGDEQYLACMRQLGTQPETTAIVDGRTVRGIGVGKRLGCVTSGSPEETMRMRCLLPRPVSQPIALRR